MNHLESISSCCELITFNHQRSNWVDLVSTVWEQQYEEHWGGWMPSIKTLHCSVWEAAAVQNDDANELLVHLDRLKPQQKRSRRETKSRRVTFLCPVPGHPKKKYWRGQESTVTGLFWLHDMINYVTWPGAWDLHCFGLWDRYTASWPNSNSQEALGHKATALQLDYCVLICNLQSGHVAVQDSSDIYVT